MKYSSGVLMYRFDKEVMEILLVHPGGPYWIKKDNGAWSIPKGEFIPVEESADRAAKREFEEETGFAIQKDIRYIGRIKSKQKIIYVWVVEDSFDASDIKSNTFSIEWPPKSGKQKEFVEIDRAEWFTVEEAEEKMHKSQVPILDEVKNYRRK